MSNIRTILLSLPFTAILALHTQASWSAGVEPDDQKLIDAAGCDEIVKQYRIHVAQEKVVVEEIRRSSNNTVATNVVGAAALATVGIGFFVWDDNEDAEENLAELRAYRDAIAAAGRKKGCTLSAQ